ncbi:MAG: ATP-sensitive inward rectifier potassium channel 10 [Deltaproteobacteria bacterium]|nr:ATP-sensitive inward rectifier potassium channel 10 [Deltaproteobacteria bacterium]
MLQSMSGQVHHTSPTSVRPASRPIFTTDANLTYIRTGLPAARRHDLYHWLLRSSWVVLFSLLVSVFLTINCVFATIYLLLGDGIANARPGSFGDVFFFSVQTIATIGYGVMAPRSLPAHLVVTAEVLCGFIMLAVVTGLTFAKFSRPTARVLFSKPTLISMRDGVPSLVFRMANARGTGMVEARAHVVFSRDEVTAEGEAVRRFYDLPLLRDQNIMFALSWTVVHPIREDSPLFGQTADSLAADEAAVIVSVTGLDEVLGQTVHARHAYESQDIHWGKRFVDILSVDGDGRRTIDYARFHDLADDA